MSEDMSNLMGQISNMLNNNEMPDEIKNIIHNLQNSSNVGDSEQDNVSSDSSIPEFDINTMIKMKKIMDSMNSKKDDPRSNLLRSLKPYLKESRKEKVDQYIQLFGMGKVFEMICPLGGEKKK